MTENYIDVLKFLEQDKYSNLSKQIEYNLISAYQRQELWKAMTPEEKQKDRKITLQSVKRYYEQDGIATYFYENIIIEIYDTCLRLIDELSRVNSSNINLHRLRITIDIIMSAIDINPGLRDKKILPSSILDDLNKDLINENIHFELLVSIFDLVKSIETEFPK